MAFAIVTTGGRGILIHLAGCPNFLVSGRFRPSMLIVPELLLGFSAITSTAATARAATAAATNAQRRPGPEARPPWSSDGVA